MFQLYDVSIDGNRPAHSALFAFAQMGVYYIAFKLWLSMNYRALSPRSRAVMHVVAHSTFAVTICFNYWLRLQQPVLLVVLYPGYSLSQSLLVQAVE